MFRLSKSPHADMQFTLLQQRRLYALRCNTAFPTFFPSLFIIHCKEPYLENLPSPSGKINGPGITMALVIPPLDVIRVSLVISFDDGWGERGGESAHKRNSRTWTPLFNCRSLESIYNLAHIISNTYVSQSLHEIGRWTFISDRIALPHLQRFLCFLFILFLRMSV